MTANRSRLLIALTALIWATGGSAIKLASLNAAQIAGGRALIAAIALYAFFPKARMRPSLEVLKTAVPYALTCILFVWANTLTTAGNAIFIQNIAPVWVLVASPWLLGERATRIELVSVAISLVGCTLFFADSFAVGRTTGDLIALAASFTYAFLIIQYRKVTQDEGILATIVGNGMIVVLCAAFAVSGPSLTPTSMAVLVYLGLIQQALPVAIFLSAIRGVSAIEGSLLLLLEPLFSPILAFLFIGESLGPTALVGALLVIGSAVMRIALTSRARLVTG